MPDGFPTPPRHLKKQMWDAYPVSMDEAIAHMGQYNRCAAEFHEAERKFQAYEIWDGPIMKNVDGYVTTHIGRPSWWTWSPNVGPIRAVKYTGAPKYDCPAYVRVYQLCLVARLRDFKNWNDYEHVEPDQIIWAGWVNYGRKL